MMILIAIWMKIRNDAIVCWKPNNFEITTEKQKMLLLYKVTEGTKIPS